ncbi:MAG: ankyrin repeat domain-containing protein [Planctomycetales bacterium]|nr:ankyrin repeat domain-containing protein [Planctomycetales bacterium]
MRKSLRYCAEKGDVESVKQMLSEGVSVDVIENGRFNETPLLAAARAGHQEIVELLLNSGANINYQDNDNFSPLTAAARAQKWSIVHLLATRGADFSKRDGYGKSGLDYLQRCRSKRTRTEISSILAQDEKHDTE